MTNKRIVYIRKDGGINIIIPAPEYLQNHTIEDLAIKDVPAGCTYYIVDVDEIPTDRTFREAWTWQ
jgi:hypothetical protein